MAIYRKMDKTWIDSGDRLSREYVNGIDQFLVFAYTGKGADSVIHCPCRQCANRYSFSQDVVRDHLLNKGMLKKYKIWTSHGESYPSTSSIPDKEGAMLGDSDFGDDMIGMINDAIPQVGTSFENNEGQIGGNEETANYFKLLEDAQSELYPGCKKFSKLSFIVRLLHMKVLNHWTDKSTDMLLELLSKTFPKSVQLPNNYYKAQKITKGLGFTYMTWDACPNSCMLFRNEHANLNQCVICGKSRWKQSANTSKHRGKLKPTKQTRYFSLKPRLQRLFMSSNTSQSMRWHA